MRKLSVFGALLSLALAVPVLAADIGAPAAAPAPTPVAADATKAEKADKKAHKEHKADKKVEMPKTDETK